LLLAKAEKGEEVRSFSLFLYKVAKNKKMDNQIIRSIKAKGERLSERMNNQTKSDRLKFLLILIGIVAVIITAYLVWNNFFNQEARERRENEKKYDQFFEALSEGENRQKEDAYGGKTPQETIDLFVAALEKDDLELASKYFSLTVEGKTDPKWLEMLQESRENGLIDKAVELIKSAEYTGESMPGYAGFDVLAEDGTVQYAIDLVKNEQSSLWKIDSI